MTILDPDFLQAAPDRAACAPFCEERRMNGGNAVKLYRKFGVDDHP
jgi:hypothetical protein